MSRIPLSESVKLSMEIDTETKAYFDAMAHEYNTTFTDIVVRGLEALALVRAARDQGLPHFGFATDPHKLDAELRGLLPEQPHLVAHP